MVPKADTYTDEELNKCWFSDDEYAEIKEDIKRHVLLKVAGHPESTDRSYRGLEFKWKVEARRRMMIRHRAWDAVILEQDRQWQKPDSDLLIAKEYSKHTASSQMEAFPSTSTCCK